ncbi:MAG: ATP-dependent protease ATP-binding subunit HslU [Meiothermus sp.]|uniref:ATP-dependent protease ATPase subunit HslU n=1 Tax=Meiothermus sp. TaxID=1955249 RepID=UPI0025F2BE49|nr:ATP-dependent protease ATPase subunit HslU [Meiothermus sp.]MDW8217548.1 ATP-dependent protease ATPase subunit HslU [Acidobacteriota bacterium]MCS7057429.1 ATP-dependent protease ATP-binding subunit HslU [Meiothermus sp.]MCS7193537.1 ATP-dependent protease ATP-binding subunit HslU [Meiothermus sp.]MCX7739978.1 ATP-dependent protease ATP-binding subunit HslU [Meiothermus sp.]MDW8091616.1 ATP-dependent protease ATPase subunit HslU [Meiothermus sp.]
MNLTPAEIVRELDKHIVGQSAAKRAVAVALRNRMRRKKLPPELAREVTPKNILMIGPTGVGKTEIARRLARLAGAPFLKVEATKFTEVGYVGRDVESIVRDLAEVSYQLVMQEMKSKVEGRALSLAEDQVAALLRISPQELRTGRYHDQYVEVEVAEEARLPMVGMLGGESMQGLQEMLKGLLPQRRVRRRMRVREALEVLKNQEAERMVDREEASQEALRRAQEEGIVFIDEIDKVARSKGAVGGPDVSGEGVQRDLLPIVEGTVVSTRLGPLSTDHVLFIAAGAFHVSKPSDLIPELQGRFPIRVELEPLGPKEFERILLEPENSLIKQYSALLAADETELHFTPEAIEAVARFAHQANQELEDIGARRLATVLERVLEEVSFQTCLGRVEITKEYVEARLKNVLASPDLSRYIL